MKQTRHHLAAIIGEKTLHIQDSKELAYEIAAYLLHEKQTGELDSLLRDVMQYRADHGAIEAIAVSANAVPDDVLTDVRDLLKREFPTAKQHIVRSKIDSDIIGGMKIDLPNQQLDLSVKSQLNKFKRLTALERNEA